MTREEAIKIIQNEYKCVDRECDIEKSCGKCPYMMPTKEPILKAYEMAIQALSQEPICDHDCEHCTWTECPIEPCEECRNKRTSFCGNCKEYDEFEPCDDAISRKAVNTLVDELARAISDERCHIPQRGRDAGHIMHDILDLPSVTQKSGKWIRYKDNCLYNQCSYCGASHCREDNYCPNCGCRMVEPQESEDKE